ncbi:hypothetical protein MBLNU230_g0557t1 [Neophaeotheca triangularis]
MYSKSFFAALAAIPTLVAGLGSIELAGKVGPLTSIADKRAVRECDITNYGARADGRTDMGDALLKAHNDCKSGGVVIIPEGDFAMSTWVKLANAKAWALQLDGTIYRTGTGEGNMIIIEHTSDFEMFSSTGKGAMQGYGYEYHQKDDFSGPRLLRFWDMQNFSAHDFFLVDSPLFHLVLDTCENGELYNMVVRGGDSGGLDGIDIWSNNIWVHDIEVTNKDECVTVKSPSKNILVENIYCNWSGGSGMGSLPTDTAISQITYRNIYTQSSNQMYMLKSSGGGGSVTDILLENFIGHHNAYSLDIDQYWSSMSRLSGPGVQLSHITARNWTGTELHGRARGPIKLACEDNKPCTAIELRDINMWTETGESQFYSCRSAYGPEPAYCLPEAGERATAYAERRVTVTTPPEGYEAPTMAADLTSGVGITESIAVPTMPASFFPGKAPFSAFAG